MAEEVGKLQNPHQKEYIIVSAGFVVIWIGKAARVEEEALIPGCLPGEGFFCRQLSREKRRPI